ncbi:hypothetical protein BABINDRAFT_35424 [Babjeviella inositovora NRRL Y-12698]|uniref:Octanoyltransferase n=1 Tax=Babjeviella inositovora NRRL Y-12698 TaxID=984486 RepID=A0A1E3QT16_9ASCO|nr:uncharacterized protein BABINDRAFT_35424 [Babjeviella inositovora NRRL Y-12698]ODQ80162.1 hypothetical protein BABINDRAFT_35424 [Babjeviella inositovora NRRL Y-12698]
MLTQVVTPNFYRYISTEACKVVKPVREASKTLRHIHFPTRRPYTEGLEIQEKFVRANLDFKLMEAKISRHQKSVAEQGYVLSDYESELLAKIASLKPCPTVLTFEFEPTYTGGKREKQNTTASDVAKYEAKGAQYVQVERGGQVTYHGPGQVVAYPILDLKSFSNLSLKCYVSKLEKAIQAVLLRGKNYASGSSTREFGIQTITTTDTGVWANEEEKIAALGINARRSITSFGAAINVATDLRYLNDADLVMCGLSDKTTTSMEALGVQSSVKDVAFCFAKELGNILGVERVEHLDGDELKVDGEE